MNKQFAEICSKAIGNFEKNTESKTGIQSQNKYPKKAKIKDNVNMINKTKSDNKRKIENLTQLEIEIKNKGIIMKHPGEKQNKKVKKSEEKSGKKRYNNSKNESKSSTKKTRRAENVTEVVMKAKIVGKDCHLNLTFPDEVDIVSMVMYNSTGIKNALQIPFGNAQFRKMIDSTTEPPIRHKTRESWERLKSMYIFLLFQEKIIDMYLQYFIQAFKRYLYTF